MLLIRPKSINDTSLTSSNITEIAPAAWNSGTTYGEGDKAVVASGTVQQVYKSLADGNLNNNPASARDWWAEAGVTHSQYSGGATYAQGDLVIDADAHRVYESQAGANTGHPLTDAAWWIDIGPTNKWAMFDSVVGTVTVHPYRIDTQASFDGRADSLAMLGLMNAVSARVVMSTAVDGTIYDQSFSLVSTAGISDWYEYFFHDVERKSALLVTGLPAYANPIIEVTIEGNGQSPVACGILSIGLSKNLGTTLQDSAQVGIDDYSLKQKDDFGNYSIAERAFDRNGTFQCIVSKAAVDGVFDTLAALRATPAFYSASEEYGSSLIFGWPKSWQIEIEYPLESLLSIELEGLA